jgi:hypothetical protein
MSLAIELVVVPRNLSQKIPGNFHLRSDLFEGIWRN